MAVKQLSIFDSIKKNKKMGKKSVGLKANGKLKKGFKFVKGGGVKKVGTKSKSKGKSSSKGSPITYAGKVGKGNYRYVYNKK